MKTYDKCYHIVGVVYALFVTVRTESNASIDPRKHNTHTAERPTSWQW